MRPRPSIFVLLVLSLCLPGLSQTVEGSTGRDRIPDEEARILLFQVMRSMPPPRWDMETKMNYLKPAGFTSEEALALTVAADDYFARIRPIDEAIEEINGANAGHNEAPDVVRQVEALRGQKAAVLESVLLQLDKRLDALSLTSATKLREQVLRVREHARMSVIDSEEPSRAGTHPSLGFRYVAMAESADGLQISAMTVANAGAKYGHKVSAEVEVWNPGHSRKALSRD